MQTLNIIKASRDAFWQCRFHSCFSMFFEPSSTVKKYVYIYNILLSSVNYYILIIPHEIKYLTLIDVETEIGC